MSHQHLDPETIVTLQEIMGDEFADLIETYIRDSKQRLDECAEALAREDAAGLHFASHALKGSSANLGATTLANLCSQIESATKKGDFRSATVPLQQIQLLYPKVTEELLKLSNS